MKRKLIIITSVMILASTLFLTIDLNDLSSQKSLHYEAEEIQSRDIEKSKSKNNETIELKSKIQDIEKNISETYMILVNKDNKLDSSFVSNDIVKSTIPFVYYVETRDLDKTVAEAAQKMFDAAKEDGIELLGASGYRPYDVQNRIFMEKVRAVGEEKAEEYLAPPGASEHQTGYAIDILSSEYLRLDSGFENTKAFKWLKENSQDYGFILRYDKDKVDITKYSYEPWHYRYVGIENAQKIANTNLCFEEYIEQLKAEIETLKENLNEMD